MMLTISFLFLALQQGTGTPAWVPAVLALLMLLLFAWGTFRGNVRDENLSDMVNENMPHEQEDEEAH